MHPIARNPSSSVLDYVLHQLIEEAIATEVQGETAIWAAGMFNKVCDLLAERDANQCR